MADQALSLEEENKKFLERIDPLMEEMVTAVLVNKPTKPMIYMID